MLLIIVIYVNNGIFTAFQLQMEGISVIKNSGELDGKCSADGPAGKVISDLILNPWMKLGHK